MSHLDYSELERRILGTMIAGWVLIDEKAKDGDEYIVCLHDGWDGPPYYSVGSIWTGWYDSTVEAWRVSCSGNAGDVIADYQPTHYLPVPVHGLLPPLPNSPELQKHITGRTPTPPEFQNLPTFMDDREYEGEPFDWVPLLMLALFFLALVALEVWMLS